MHCSGSVLLEMAARYGCLPIFSGIEPSCPRGSQKPTKLTVTKAQKARRPILLATVFCVLLLLQSLFGICFWCLNSRYILKNGKSWRTLYCCRCRISRQQPTSAFSLDLNLQSTWEPSAVGYIRHDPKIYEAPVYITSFRGPTYVFLATLKTEDPVSKWTLTGTAVLLQTDE